MFLWVKVISIAEMFQLQLLTLILKVIIFAIAFLEPQTAFKIISDPAILNVERIREAATLVMLGALATLAGKKVLDRTAYILVLGSLFILIKKG